VSRLVYMCPAGHEVTESEGRVVCGTCDLIATNYNAKTGEVFTWTDLHEHHEACRRLQDDADAAFENQYFSGGW